MLPFPLPPQQQYGCFGQRRKGVRRPDVEPSNLGSGRLVKAAQLVGSRITSCQARLCIALSHTPGCQERQCWRTGLAELT